MTDQPTETWESVPLLADMPLHGFLTALADPVPTPGGGSAAALCGALSAALVAMVAGLSAHKKGLEEVTAEMTGIAEEANALAQDLAQQIDTDARAYDAVTTAFRMPKATQDEKSARRDAIQAAMRNAAAVPLHVAEQSARCVERGTDVLTQGNPNAATDAASAILLAATAIEAACLNVAVNLESIKDEEYVADATQRIVRLRRLAQQAREEMWKIVAVRIPSMQP